MLLPCSTGYIQHSPHAVLLQQRHHPALVLLRPALCVPDVQLPDFSCFPVGILIRKPLRGHTKRAGPEYAVDRHAAAGTCRGCAAACWAAWRTDLTSTCPLLLFIGQRGRWKTFTQWPATSRGRLLSDWLRKGGTSVFTLTVLCSGNVKKLVYVTDTVI